MLSDHRALPPVLSIVLYNGRRPWPASVEMTDLVAVGSDLLAPYQPSQRYYLLDGARVADADLPADNLVSALINLEKTRDAARLREALRYGVMNTTFEGVSVRITSPARTVVDCFRFRRLVGTDFAIEALRDALYDRKASVDQIWRPADVCRAKSLVRPVLEALTA